jgi:AcrR family transcriptional regulator
MPQLIDTRSRAGTLAAAANELLVSEGIPGLTLRKIATVSRVSAGSILHHLGDKDRLLSLSAALTAEAFQAEIERRRWLEGVPAFLPQDDDQVLSTRAWLAWVELARSDDAVEPPVTRSRHRQRDLLASTLDHCVDREDLDLTVAVIEGLRTAVCAPVRPMSPTRARELLLQHLRRLGVQLNPAGEGP